MAQSDDLAGVLRELEEPGDLTHLLGRLERSEDLLLDALCSDRALRASLRRRLLPGRGPRSFRNWYSDPRSFRRRVEATVPVGAESYPSTRRHLLGLGLLHPDDAMASAAAALVRRERKGAGNGGRLTGNRARAAEELAGEWVARWVEWGSACGPSDRELVEDGIRRCYELSGERWHGRVIWAASPFTGALLDRLPRSRAGLLWHERRWSGDPRAIGPRYPDDLRYRMDQELAQLAGHDLVRRVETLVQGPVEARLALPPWFLQPLQAWNRSHLHIGPVDPDRARLALAGMGGQLPRRARARLRRQLEAGDVLEAVAGLVGVGYSHLDGHLLAAWLAKATLLLRVCGGDAAGTLEDRLTAYRDANAAGPWWPDGDAVVVAERPQVVRSELIDSPEGPRRRLHAEDGPAVLWGDGTASHAVHGVLLPFDLVRPGWSIRRILDERNTELRRVAIERLGWDRFVAEAGLFLVDGPVPDPGNPGNTLTLYAVPPAYGTGEMLLLCTNASPDRDGTVRRFGLHVPAGFDDAVAAAAWTFDLDRRTYGGLERAT